MAEMMLVPELIPEPLWGLSAARRLGRKTKAWRNIRTEILREAHDSCVACGLHAPGGKQLICDEVWRYDESARVATLDSLRILCPACDRARHFGMAGVLGVAARPGEQLMAVNQIDEAVAVALLRQAGEDWTRRSRLSWTTAIRPELLARFPALRTVADEVGRPGAGRRRAKGRDGPGGIGSLD